jgi:hypothetical protein
VARLRLASPANTPGPFDTPRAPAFSLNASVRIEATDRAGLERLLRYCARPPFALERLHLVAGRSDQVLYLLPDPDLYGRTALRLSALELPPLTAHPTPPLRRTPLRSVSSIAWPRSSPLPASTVTATTASSPRFVVFHPPI